MLQRKPGTKTILRLPNGDLMRDCCCVKCVGTCCCDPDIDVWFRSPLTIQITELKVSGSEHYSPSDLSCLLGTWVLPAKLIDSEHCGWENTFSAGYNEVDPAHPEDCAVFRIEVTMSRSSSSYNSENGTDTHLSDVCADVKITFLSCRDCLGNIMSNKPYIIIDDTSANHVCSELSINAEGSVNFTDSTACGCNSGKQDRNVDGSWNRLILDAGYSGSALDYSELEAIGYSGYCWTHPDAVFNGGTLQLWDAEVVDETGATHACVNLASLDRSILYKKDFATFVSMNAFDDTSHMCEWIPDEVTTEFGKITPQVGGPLDTCAYKVVVNTAYLVNEASVTCGFALTPVAGPTIFDVGCAGDTPWAWNTIATGSDGMHNYTLRVKAGWFPMRFDSCQVNTVVNVGKLPCDETPSFNTCDCNYLLCLGDPYGHPAPEDPQWTGRWFHPGFNTACPVPDPITVCGACACQAAEDEICSCVKILPKVPLTFQANDKAAEGARYEIIYSWVDDSAIIYGTDPIVVDYSLIYRRYAGDQPNEGYWALEYLPPALASAFSTCICTDGDADCVSMLQAAASKINTSAIATTFADMSLNASVGRVPADSLANGGVWSNPKKKVWVDLGSENGYWTWEDDCTDNGPWFELEITLYYRNTSIANDPCCDCVDMSANPDYCVQFGCNKCTCVPHGGDDDNGYCHKPIKPVPYPSRYCCPCYGLTDYYAQSKSYACCHDITSWNPDGSGVWSPTDPWKPGLQTTTKECHWVPDGYSYNPDFVGYSFTPFSGEIHGEQWHLCNSITDPYGVTWLFLCKYRADGDCDIGTTELGNGCNDWTPGGWNCDEQRYSVGYHNLWEYYCGPVSSMNPDSYITSCAAEVTRTRRYNFRGDCSVDCARIVGENPIVDNIRLASPWSVVVDEELVVGRLPGCVENVDTGQGNGTGHGGIVDCPWTSPDINPNICSSVWIEGEWWYRKHTTKDLADAELADVYTAYVYFFPGDGSIHCSVQYPYARYYVNAPPFDYPPGTPDNAINVYLYTKFAFSFTSYSKCGDLSTPAVKFVEICPSTPGTLVHRTISGQVDIGYDNACASVNCTNPLGG